MVVELLQRPVPAFVFEAGRQAPDLLSRFEDADLMPGSGEVPSHRQPGRARADDADLELGHALPLAKLHI